MPTASGRPARGRRASEISGRCGAADVTESERGDRFAVLSLPALVRIKLTAFRDKDRTHLRDLIEVGLVGRATLASLPPILAARLTTILETPEG